MELSKRRIHACNLEISSINCLEIAGSNIVLLICLGMHKYRTNIRKKFCPCTRLCYYYSYIKVRRVGRSELDLPEGLIVILRSPLAMKSRALSISPKLFICNMYRIHDSHMSLSPCICTLRTHEQLNKIGMGWQLRF